MIISMIEIYNFNFTKMQDTDIICVIALGYLVIWESEEDRQFCFTNFSIFSSTTTP